jgi:hypothetical protein
MPVTIPPNSFASLPPGRDAGSHAITQPDWDGVVQCLYTETRDRIGGAHNLAGYQDCYVNRWLSARTGAPVFAHAGSYNFLASQGVGSPDHLHYNVSVAGGSMTAGSPATITITPVPWGVNGDDSAIPADMGEIGRAQFGEGVGPAGSVHILTVTDGASTENVTVTGGTAIAGSSSGTLVFTPANNHSGGTWTLGSSTFGVYEAKNDLPSDLTKLQGALLLSNGPPEYYASGAWNVLGSPIQQDFSTAYNSGTLTHTLSGIAKTLNVFRNELRKLAGVHYQFTPGTNTFTMLIPHSVSADDSLWVERW